MNLSTMPRAVIFDMDGLLFDTEPLWIRSLIAAAAEHGHEMTHERYRPFVGLPWPVIRGLLIEGYGPDFPIDAVRASWVRGFRMLAETELAVKTGAVELLDLLDELGLPRAIATSSARPSVDHHLAAHGLSGRFDAIVAQGDYAAGKPAPDPFLRAAKRLGVEPGQCLALEDSHNGVRSASSAGMMTVMVPDQLEPTAEIHRLCAAVATDLHEVAGLIRALRPR